MHVGSHIRPAVNEANESSSSKQPVFLIIDPSLKDFVGHHFSYVEAVARGATEAGYRAVTLANRDATDAIADRLAMQRCLRRDMWSSHPMASHVPARFRTAFDTAMTNREFLIDLRAGLSRVAAPAGSVMFAPMIFRNQLNAFADFVASQEADATWEVVLLLRYQPAWYDNALSARAFRKLEHAAATGRRVRLASDSARLAAELGALTTLPIEVLPIPHTVGEHETRPSRPSDAPLRLVSLGNARDEKGFCDILSAIRLLDAAGEMDGMEFRLQAHDAAPDVQAAIDGFVPVCPPQVTLLRSALSPEDYTRTLLDADVVLVPYWRGIYRARTPGVCLESMAAGKIVVATSGTWMSEELSQYGGGVLIDDHSPVAIVEAIRRIRRDHALLATKAEAGRRCVIARHNPASLIAQIQNGPDHAGGSERAARRVAVFYPWGNFLERQSGASLRCNLLVEKLAERAVVRVVQDGSWGSQRPGLSQLCRMAAAMPFVMLRRLLGSAGASRPGPHSHAQLPSPLRRPRVSVEAVRPRMRQHLARRLLRLVTPRTGGQESMLWFFIDRRLDPYFKAHAADVVRWADVVIVEYPFWASIIAPICRAEGKCLIVSSHDVLSQQASGSQILDRLTARLEVEGMRGGDVAVTVSDSDRAWYAARGVPSIVVPNPIDHDRLSESFGPDPRTLLRDLYALELPPGPFCLFVGSRYQPNTVAVERLRGIANDCPDTGFVVVGDCAPVSRHGNFTALGRVDEAVLAVLYQAAALVVIPLATGTGSSIKTVEAMSAGRMVLGTAVAFRGLDPSPVSCIVQEDDLARWPALIAGLLADPERRLSGEKAARQAARHYDYRRIFEPYVALLGLQHTPAQSDIRRERHSMLRELLAVAFRRGRHDIAATLLENGVESVADLVEGLAPVALNAALDAVPLGQALTLADALFAAGDQPDESTLARLVLRAHESGQRDLAEALLVRLEALASESREQARRSALEAALQHRNYDTARELLRA
ncbi:Glycosyltransferase involved in cell wall bisynthesis [Falsiroseomonas stagni DSM 19981]|uniref:Glycosyltransferase involved in cell wall bisynthesis n=1 Tax=Falsiroseomonas stagni DSM 19981 TaxID=1123062 RepID=A0A1I4ER11_9PROT|nr:Glycosyltransferase involved in cell wall bisynthesis [Falsiroseomonas stagni DSM 19981]